MKQALASSLIKEINRNQLLQQSIKKMQRSQAQENSQQCQQIICVSCKTFFGSTQTANMCSKCFKLYQGGQQLIPVLNNAIDGIKGINSEVRNTQQPANEENKVAQQEIRQQVDKSKCYMCQRKIGVVGIQCRCGFMFCSKHRHSEDHSCTFNYEKLNQDKLKKENPLVPKQKFDKLSVLTYVNQKAGMENISKEDIQKKIYEITKNSEYYKKQKEREIEQDKRIQQIQQQLELKIQDQHSVYNSQIWVEQTLNQLESKRNFSRVWIHIDMDMFYAAVELRDQPELNDQPMAVGDKSMISTSNYIARKYGVRSAMPGFIALKLCPQLVLVPPNFQKYKDAATSIREIFKLYDPDYESGGLDEVYLDVTNFLVLNQNYTPESVAQEIRQKVFEKEKLTCSAGIACNKMLAKICTDVKKPNDQFHLPFDATEIKKFIGQLDIRKIPGIGGVSQRELNGLSIFKCEDIIQNAYKLFIAFKNDKYVKWLLKCSIGISSSKHSAKEEQKSLSISRTFSKTNDEEQILNHLKDFSTSLASDLKDMKKVARTISQESKHVDLQSEDDIFQFAKKIFLSIYKNSEIRFLRIGLYHLQDPKKSNSLKDYFTKISNSGKIKETGLVQKAQQQVKKYQFICHICGYNEKIGILKMQEHIAKCPPQNFNNQKNCQQNLKRKNQNDVKNQAKKRKVDKNQMKLDNMFKK